MSILMRFAQYVGLVTIGCYIVVVAYLAWAAVKRLLRRELDRGAVPLHSIEREVRESLPFRARDRSMRRSAR
jgi:hypothetical protein